MGQYRLKGPDGRTFVVDAPPGATREEVLARVKAQASKPLPANSTATQAAGIAGNFLDGILPGASGFVRGAGEVVKNAVRAPLLDAEDFHPVQSYNQGRAFQEARNRMALQGSPALSNVAAGAGLAAGLALPASKIAKGASLAQKARAGAMTAGAYSAASGAMSSQEDSILGKAGDALSSGVIGAAAGFGLPYAAKMAGALAAPMVRPIAQPAARMFGKGLAGLGDFIPGRAGKWIAAEGQQLSRDPIRSAANQQLDHDLRAAVNPATGRAFTPAEVADEVRRRHQLGVPAAPADVHESARRSYAAAARAPGPATASVRRMIDRRQEQSTQRVTEHIAGTLGPTTNVEAQEKALNAYAKEAAVPLYAISDAHPIDNVQELQELFRRPAAHEALQVAGTQLRNEGEDLTRYGLIEDADGVFHLGQAPTMPMYDRAKTALDQTVYDGAKPLAAPEVTRASRGAATIRSRLLQLMDGDGSGPPIRQPGTAMAPGMPSGVPGAPMQASGAPMAQLPSPMLQGLPTPPPGLKRLPAPGAPDPQVGNPFPVPFEAPQDPKFARRLTPDAPEVPAPGPRSSSVPPEGLNPYWKPAREAYAGPVQARKALELGEEMAKDGGEDIANRMGDLTGTQRDFFRLGHRSGLATDVKALGDWGNAAARVGGSLKKREGLQAAHGPLADELLQRTHAEHEAHQTWKAIRGNSQTPDRLAEMMAQDAQLTDMAGGAMQAMAGHPILGLGKMAKAMVTGNKADREVKEHIASVLAEQDPVAMAAAFRDIQREKARKALVRQNAGKANQQASRVLGGLVGTNMIEPVDDGAPY